MSLHSQLPWHVGDVTMWNPGNQRTVRIASGDVIALVTCSPTFAERDPNAEFIVKAVNHHAELVGLLQQIIDDAEPLGGDDAGCSSITDALIDAARAVLAKVK